MARAQRSLTARAATVLGKLPYPARLALYYGIGVALALGLLVVASPRYEGDAAAMLVAFLLTCLFGLPYAVSWFLFALFYRGFVVTWPLEIVILGTVLAGVTRLASLLPDTDRMSAPFRDNLRIAAIAAIVGLIILLLSTGGEVLITRCAPARRTPPAF